MRGRTAVCCGLFILAFLSPFIAPPPSCAHGNKPIIVDTDMGLDDARALLALLADTDMDIVAIVMTEGSASLGRGTDNIFGLLESAGAVDIPVFEGAALAVAPQWRNMADSLGGFAPRRNEGNAAVTHPLDDLAQLLAGEHNVAYLALGPLGSLASLMRDRGETLAHIVAIYLPASVAGGTLTAWNLIADAPATELVFERAGDIVLVDIAEARGAEEAMRAAIRRETPASHFVRNTLAADTSSEHSFLYDEIAAACMMNPALAETAGETYRLQTGKKLVLHPDSRGNVRLAHLTGPDAVVELLRSRWERDGLGSHAADHDDFPIERLLTIFHGHLGPYVVLGYRMGRLALEATGAAGHFDISAEVHSLLEPPPSCLIDGVQLGAGCTIGKRNIEVAATDGPAYGIFTAKNGRRAIVRLRPELPARIDSLIQSIGVEGAGRAILEAPDGDLFSIEISESTHGAANERGHREEK